MKFLKRPEVQIPLLFLVISTLWIIFSDKLFLTVTRNITITELTEIQTIKGCFFVIAVACIIHFMIKSSSRKLVKSQEEYRDLFFNTPNPMFISHSETNKFCNVNKAAIDTYGYSLNDFAALTIDDIKTKELKNDLLVNGEVGKVTLHRKKNNETITCIELSRNISFNSSPAKLLTVNDITELEKIKADLIDRESQLQQILRSITDGFFILNKDLIIEKANELFVKFAEVQLPKITGCGLFDVFPTLKATACHQHYVYAMNSGNPVHFQYYYEHSKKWFDISAYPYNGGLSVFFRDITKEKEYELQRLQNEQNMLALINNTKDLMWSVDRDCKYFIFNEPYKEVYKRAFGEEVYVGKCALNEKQGAEHKKKWKGLYERTLKGEKFSIDMDFVLPDGSYFTTIWFNPITDTDGNIIGVGCFLQDITASKLQIKKIEQQNEQLKRIAFITSHKVRVPLANILGLAEVLDVEDPLSPSNCKIIEHIKTSAKQLDASIINMVQQAAHVNE